MMCLFVGLVRPVSMLESEAGEIPKKLHDYSLRGRKGSTLRKRIMPAIIAATKRAANGSPDAKAVMPGPGQYPPRPQPIPKSAEPVLDGESPAE